MEFFIINSNKLKIKMTSDDMKKYGISPTDSGRDSPRIRRAFWSVLDEAREACGFTASGEKLLLQLYPSDGGGELFVTKLTKIGGSREQSLMHSESVAMLQSRPTVYRFSSFSRLVCAAKRVPTEAKNAASEAYLSDDGAYYLVLEERSLRGAPSEVSLIGEFASEVPYILLPYIREHSTVIVENSALNLLSEL